jgi:exodeoxyribonuclease-5
MIDKGEFSLTSKQKFLLGRNQKYASLIPYQFTFAYAITTHKAQGSSWKNVLVIEEKFPYQSEEHKRWLYTAITRGEEKVVVVR